MENQNKCCIGNKESVFRILVILLIITSVFMFFKTTGVYQSNKYIGHDIVSNTINVSGEGEVFAVADIATFTFSVREESKTSSEAQNLSSEKINKTLNFLKENDIDEKDIKTTNYNVYPRYEWKSDPKALERCLNIECPPVDKTRVLVGYEVTQTISVKVRDTEKAGTILSGIGELGVSNISGLNFSIDDEDEMKREARKLAIEDAEVKAKELARDLGVKIVRIVNFNESGVSPYYARATFAVAEQDSLGKGIGGAIAPEIPLGENKITSNVTITYEIR